MISTFKASELTHAHIAAQLAAGASDMRAEYYGSGDATLNYVARLMVECYMQAGPCGERLAFQNLAYSEVRYFGGN